MQELAWDRRRHLPLNLELRKVCNRINCDFTSVKESLCADSTLDRTNFLLSFDNNNNDIKLSAMSDLLCTALVLV